MPPAKNSWQKLTERSSRQGAITLTRPRAEPKRTLNAHIEKRTLNARIERPGATCPRPCGSSGENRRLAERKSANSAIVRPGLCVLADFAPSRTASPIAACQPVRPTAVQPLAAADISIQACFSSPVAMPMSISLLRWSTSSTGSKVALIRSETVMSSSSNCE